MAGLGCHYDKTPVLPASMHLLPAWEPIPFSKAVRTSVSTSKKGSLEFDSTAERIG